MGALITSKIYHPGRVDLRALQPTPAALKIKLIDAVRRKFIDGNLATALGLIEAGVRWFSGYPITPSSEVEEAMAKLLLIELLEEIGMNDKEIRGVFLQMEDEIAGIAAAIGASAGGTMAATATSGPGMSLKLENIGYAAITEIPIVIVSVMRGGPSTGGPTDVAQADVMQARWGSHGDYPIVVLSPATVEECYYESARAVALAQAYRLPVILLSDAVVGQMKETVQLPPRSALPVINRPRPTVAPAHYLPYAHTLDGVPPMADLGTAYRTHFTGLWHGANGLPTKDPAEIDAQLRRLCGKIHTPQAQADILKTENFLADDAEVLVVAYGVTSRSAKKAVVRLRRQGTKAGLVRPITLWPSDPEALLKAVKPGVTRKVVVAELNLGQYLLEVQRILGSTGVEVVGLNKVDSNLITPAEIMEALNG